MIKLNGRPVAFTPILLAHRLRVILLANESQYERLGNTHHCEFGRCWVVLRIQPLGICAVQRVGIIDERLHLRVRR